MKLPRINFYQCQYGCLNVTVDVDKGVTPFMIKCVAKPRPDRPISKIYLDENGECKGIATSGFYPKGPRPAHIPEPSHEWYKPNETEFGKLSREELEHVSNGGLLLRPRTSREPLYND